ncbi:tetratricopeptide repeat protein [Bradyrhizobium sp. CB1650]|uniref:winged helix-turn-helix domain-containing tetratricopeptide repeat protein n=1 Tax=Bradyrhizobium sp. CB1650 TaxID=3039153 RepID=UPI002434EB66|nr:tetratricopeptide repeat protein [Bradyrhizobium sp. CB1650]WGD54527.1 tetratricopeptide repeat protein [Bradyrhizobium sp. CB1650]
MRYFFEDCVFNTARRELHRGADVVSIAPQTFDFLHYLIRNRGRVVSKDELIDAIWKRRAVSDAALTTRLNAARSAIGDSGEEQRLIKTLPRKGFRFVGQVREAREVAGSVPGQAEAESAPAVPDRPSIAVLPFENLSGDPEQEYFADGMVDEITTALSRFRSLFVVGRNSSFTYKGKAVDSKQVGHELGVRYVLEGSVRKADGKVRIIGQIDAATGVHLWADRFEGDLGDIFTLQDRMTECVVAAIEPKVFQTEIDLAARRPNSFSAYDLCLRAVPHLYSFTRGGSAEALRLASRALEIDPRYGFAARVAGSCHIQNVTRRWAIDPKSEFIEGLRLLQLALSIDGNDHIALSMLGYAAAWSGDFDTAREMVDRAICSNPNAAFAWSTRGWTYQVTGNPEEAIRSFERAVLLSPFDPMLFATFTEMAVALIGLGRFDEAVVAAKKALSQTQIFVRPYCCLTAALAHLGREAEARDAAARLLELKPDFRISEWAARSGPRTHQMFIDGLRKAGIPK